MKLEAIVSSYEDATIACKIVDSIELNTALNLLGLTANLTTLKMIKKNCDIEVNTVLRVRAAGFNYTELEFEEMKEQAIDLINAGSDGLVFGILNNQFEIDVKRVKEIAEIAKNKGKKIYFSNAFDLVNDYSKEIEKLIEMGFDGLKTRGLESDIEIGLVNLKKIQEKYGNKIEVIASGNINYTNIEEIAKQSGITTFVLNAYVRQEDETTVNNGIDYSYLKEKQYEKISPYMLNRMKFILDNSKF